VKINLADEFESKLLNYLHRAINLVYRRDIDLIKRDVGERSIAFRLGHYLQSLILRDEEINKLECKVDAEYNKNFLDPKTAFGNCFNCTRNTNCYIKLDNNEYDFVIKKKKYRETILSFVERYDEGKNIMPDIILHKRNNNDNNLLVIETKKVTNNNIPERALDLAKLSYLTCKYEGTEYKFKLGCFLDFGIDNCRIEIFKDGQRYQNR
jgi:hypothetical protein